MQYDTYTKTERPKTKGKAGMPIVAKSTKLAIPLLNILCTCTCAYAHYFVFKLDNFSTQKKDVKTACQKCLFGTSKGF